MKVIAAGLCLVVIAAAACTRSADAPLASSAPASSTTAPAAQTQPPLAASPDTTVATTTTTTTTTTTSTVVPEDVTPPQAIAIDTSDGAVGERLAMDIDAFRAIGPRPAGTDAEGLAAAMIRETLGTLSLAYQTTDVPLPNGLVSQNITARLGDGDTVILLGAHYDSKPESPGIDDNASGVALLLELARRYAVEPPAAFELRLVFFGAEEVLEGMGKDDHHFGSRQMAAAYANAGDLPDLMISVDMVAVGSRLFGVALEGHDPTAASLLAAAGFSVGVQVTTLERGDISDHEAFARAGVPAVFMWRPDNPTWHTAADTEVSPPLLLEDLVVLEALLDGFK